MSAQEEITLLQTNVSTLLDKYAGLQKQVSMLVAANEAQHEEIVRTHAELAEMKRRYNDLHTAHVLTADDAGKERARRQLTSLISRIDKAMMLLTADSQQNDAECK